MNVKFPNAKVIHKKKSHEMHFVYNVGPNMLKKIEFIDALCIWCAVESAMRKRKGR